MSGRDFTLYRTDQPLLVRSFVFLFDDLDFPPSVLQFPILPLPFTVERCDLPLTLVVYVLAAARLETIQ